MPSGITGREGIDEPEKNDCEDPIFNSREEMNRSLSRFCYGNLHVIGSLWVEGLKLVLVGKKMCLIPTVEAAAKKDEPPKKPPRMKYKDLPLYERPHWEYKQYLEDQENKCLGKNAKILQGMVHPTVVGWRKSFVDTGCGLTCFLNECYCELSQDIANQWRCFKCCMRAKEYFEVRAATVAAATAAGFLFGVRNTKLLTGRIFWTSVGALSAGALCFPKETDENVRMVGHELNKVLLILHNIWTGGSEKLPEIGPCEKDKPCIPPKRTIDKKHQCIKPPPPKPAKK